MSERNWDDYFIDGKRVLHFEISTYDGAYAVWPRESLDTGILDDYESQLDGRMVTVHYREAERVKRARQLWRDSGHLYRGKNAVYVVMSSENYELTKTILMAYLSGQFTTYRFNEDG